MVRSSIMVEGRNQRKIKREIHSSNLLKLKQLNLKFQFNSPTKLLNLVNNKLQRNQKSRLRKLNTRQEKRRLKNFRLI